jgi:two-component system sensor histidine kinase/response regulator
MEGLDHGELPVTESATRILVVDDEVGMREGCRRALASQGFRVSTAEHGADCLRQVREGAFDLVLLDAMMPGMSGLELLERIHDRDPDTVCVMITGYATVDLAAQAMKQGADGFLPKPFTADELLTAVRQGLEERQQRRLFKQRAEQAEEIRQLERARQEMARLDAFESRFMLVVVHELRNPAGVIKNYLQLMRSGFVDDDEWDDYLEKLDLRASQLLEMLDDLLELAHLKGVSSPSKVEPVAVADLLQEVVRELSPGAEAKGLRLVLEIQDRPVMLAQRSHLRSLWTHLIGNAIRYTPADGVRPGGQVRVKLGLEDGQIRTQVSDTGIGISTEELTRVFQEFYRSESAREQVPFGTGLGLAIVNQVVQIYRGTIQVESKPGEGSTITTRFPAAQPESDATL